MGANSYYLVLLSGENNKTAETESQTEMIYFKTIDCFILKQWLPLYG